MTDTYLRESQLLVLQTQEKALSYLRSGGDIHCLEGISLREGRKVEQSEEASADLKAEARKDLLAAGLHPPRGLKVSDVSRVLLDALGASVAMDGATGEALASERELDIKEDDIVSLLDVPTVEEAASDEEVGRSKEAAGSSEEGGESTTSDEEFYTEHFLSAGSTVRSAIHKPRPGDSGAPRCGVSAKKFHVISSEEALSGKAIFCQRCFGKPAGCDKICTRTKQMEKDGELIRIRCMRRCTLGCDPIARFLDEDKRLHLCANHREQFDRQEEKEMPEASPLGLPVEQSTAAAEG